MWQRRIIESLVVEAEDSSEAVTLAIMYADQHDDVWSTDDANTEVLFEATDERVTFEPTDIQRAYVKENES